MTRDQAINYLYSRGMSEEQVNGVVEALSQADDDAISRQAVLASIKNLYPDMPIVDIFGARRKWLEKYAPYFECENAIEQLPPVKPQPICEEREKGECPYYAG